MMAEQVRLALQELRSLRELISSWPVQMDEVADLASEQVCRNLDAAMEWLERMRGRPLTD